MTSFSFKPAQTRSTAAVRAQPSKFERHLLNGTAPVQRERVDADALTWHKSSRELRDGCDVQMVDLDALPAELLRSFR